MEYFNLIAYVGLAFVVWLISSLILQDGFFSVERPWGWLKGSRTSYALRDHKIYELESGASYRGTISIPIIEIRKFLWWRWGKVHGLASQCWRITNLRRKYGEGYDIFLNWERREDLGSALRLINAYPNPLSPHEMLDRIDELEKELDLVKNQREEWSAGVQAALLLIGADRSRYRSIPAQRIRQCLEAMTDRATYFKEPLPHPCKIVDWNQRFKNKFEEDSRRLTPANPESPRLNG